MARITEVFGPRPRHPGFKCMDCGSTEYPIFGVALAVPRRNKGEHRASYARRVADWEPEAAWHNLCNSCLIQPKNLCPESMVTEDARKAIEAHSRPEDVPRLGAIGVSRRRGSITLGR